MPPFPDRWDQHELDPDSDSVRASRSNKAVVTQETEGGWMWVTACCQRLSPTESSPRSPLKETRSPLYSAGQLSPTLQSHISESPMQLIISWYPLCNFSYHVVMVISISAPRCTPLAEQFSDDWIQQSTFLSPHNAALHDKQKKEERSKATFYGGCPACVLKQITRKLKV